MSCLSIQIINKIGNSTLKQSKRTYYYVEHRGQGIDLEYIVGIYYYIHLVALP